MGLAPAECGYVILRHLPTSSVEPSWLLCSRGNPRVIDVRIANLHHPPELMRCVCICRVRENEPSLIVPSVSRRNKDHSGHSGQVKTITLSQIWTSRHLLQGLPVGFPTRLARTFPMSAARRGTEREQYSVASMTPVSGPRLVSSFHLLTVLGKVGLALFLSCTASSWPLRIH